MDLEFLLAELMFWLYKHHHLTTCNLFTGNFNCYITLKFSLQARIHGKFSESVTNQII